MKSVRRRLFQAFLTVLICFLLVSAAVFVANEAIISRYRMLTDNLLQEYQLVKRAEPFVTDYFSYTKAIGDAGRRTIYEDDRQAYLDGLAVLGRSLTDKDSQLALAAVRNTVTSMLAEAEAAVHEVENGDLTRMSSRFDEVSRLATFVRETGTGLVVSDLAAAARLNDETVRLRALLDSLVLSLLAIVTLGGIMFVFTFTGTIVTPLLALVDFAKRAGKGDLAVQLPEMLTASDDETGTLARALRQMVDAMNQRLKDLEKAHKSTMAIVEGIPLGAHTFRLEEDGRLVFVATNRSASKIIGPDHVKMLGQTLEEAFPGNVGTEIPEAYRRVAVTGVPFEKIQYSYSSGSITGVFELYAVQTAPQEVTVFFRDVTEKQRAEDMVRRSEAELKAAQAVAHVGSWTYDATKSQPSISEELRGMVGLPANDSQKFMGLLDHHVHPDDRAALDAAIAGLRQGKKPSPLGIRLVRVDGTVRSVWLEFGEPELDQTGRLVAASGVCQDITERRTAEQALSDSERRYRTFVENTSDVIFATDVAGRLTYISPKIAQYGLTGEEVIGRNFLDFVAAEDRARLGESFKKALGPVGDSEKKTARLTNGRGESFWIEESCSVQRDERGQAIGIIGVIHDVSDHHLALMKLAESERRWRAFAENSKDVVFAADLQGRLTYVSPQIRQYGFDDAALAGQTFLSVIHPDDAEAVASKFSKCISGAEPTCTYTMRVTSPGGTAVWMETNSRLQLVNDRPVGVIGILHDVTARRGVEAAQRQAAAIERLFAIHSTALVTADAATIEARINEALADLGRLFEVERASLFVLHDNETTIERKYAWFSQGVAASELPIRDKVRDWPWSVNAVRGKDVMAFNGFGQLPPEAVVEMKRLGLSDGASVIIVPIRTGDRLVAGLVLADNLGRHAWHDRDFISMRLLAELFGQALGRQDIERKLREASLIIDFSGSVAFSCLYDEGLSVEYVSSNILTLTGYNDFDFISGQVKIQQALHPDDVAKFGEFVRRLAQDRTATEALFDPLRVVAKDGTVRWISGHLSVERDAVGNPLRVRGMLENVTTRYVAEQKVRELNRMRQTFIQIVAHQLRTPLNSIRWSLESMLNGELGEMKKEQRDFVRVVYDAEIEIISRIHDMLTALDIEEGRVMVIKENVELLPLFNSVISEVTAQAKRRGITIVTIAAGQADVAIEADAEKLRFIAKALLQNAVIYSHDGGRVEVTIETGGGQCRLQVRDEGIGIPAAEQASIFNRFFRASNASVVNQNASGLGLSIAKYYLERHGGRLSFVSVEGQGTTFTAELPLA